MDMLATDVSLARPRRVFASRKVLAVSSLLAEWGLARYDFKRLSPQERGGYLGLMGGAVILGDAVGTADAFALLYFVPAIASDVFFAKKDTAGYYSLGSGAAAIAVAFYMASKQVADNAPLKFALAVQTAVYFVGAIRYPLGALSKATEQRFPRFSQTIQTTADSIPAPVAVSLPIIRLCLLSTSGLFAAMAPGHAWQGLRVFLAQGLFAAGDLMKGDLRKSFAAFREIFRRQPPQRTNRRPVRPLKLIVSANPATVPPKPASTLKAA